MAKKALLRTTSMQKTINQGKVFLEGTKSKKITKTRTMMKTIEEGKPIIAPKKAKNLITRAPKKEVPKVVAAKVTAPKKKAKAAPKPMLKAAVPSFPAGILGGTGVLSSPKNKTIFKKPSRSDLPLPAYGFIDICFCIDCTGSMGSELEQSKSTIKTIITRIQSKVRTEGITLRFAVVSYRDHPPQDSTYVTTHQDFTDAGETLRYISTLTAVGGGDFAEAVHDGLLVSCEKLNWVSLPHVPVLKYIFHIADAPPHGREFLNVHESEGCLCGLQTDRVMHAINIRQIHYRLIKAKTNPQLDKMEQIFRSKLTNFDSASLGAAHQMNIKVSDMIIQEIVPL